MSKSLIGVIRDERGKSKKLRSDSNTLVSDRWMNCPLVGISHEWVREREMREVPLYLTEDRNIETQLSQDYAMLPGGLQQMLSRGALRTSGDISTNYSVLIPVAKSEEGNEQGRTGIILYNHEPVIVNIGGNDFAIEIKGVGRPDGKNGEVVLHERTVAGISGKMMLGSLSYGDGQHEYDVLELTRERDFEDFRNGNSPRALALQRKGIVGVLYRLTPSNIRVSYKGNPSLDEQLDTSQLVDDVARQWTNLAKQDELLIHDNIHPENIVKCGSSYCLTDLADVEGLAEKFGDISGKDFLGRVLNRIKEIREILPESENRFYSAISRGLGLEYTASNYAEFVEDIWSGFFAERVYRKVEGKKDRAVKKADEWKKALQKTPLNDGNVFLAVEEAGRYFQKEVELLEPVDSPVAKQSLALAREKLIYLDAQLKDTSDFRNTVLSNSNKLYEFFVLPYMEPSL